MMLVRSTRSINFFHIRAVFCFLPAIWMSSTYTDKVNKKDIPSSGLFSLPSPNRTSSSCLSHKSQQAGDHRNFTQEEPPGLRCLTKIWATCVVERHPFLHGCKLILRRRPVQRIPVISQWHPPLLLRSFVALTSLVLWVPRVFFFVFDVLWVGGSWAQGEKTTVTIASPTNEGKGNVKAVQHHLSTHMLRTKSTQPQKTPSKRWCTPLLSTFWTIHTSSATLWVRDTRLIVGLLLSMILITASLSSKKYNWASNWESFAFVTTWSTLDNSSTSRLLFLFDLVLGLVLWISLRAQLDYRPSRFDSDLSLLDGCSLKDATLLSPRPIDRE